MRDRLLHRRIFIALVMMFLMIGTQGFSQLVLNEMMPFNGTTLADQFNEYPDWLEVFNSGTETEYLGNYWLSDDRLVLKKWNLPAIPLPAHDYMVYFASGRDIATSISYWHTVVDLGDEWKHFSPTSDIGTSWRSSTAATSGWSTGKSGIGYSDNDDSTEIGTTIALYMQYTFDLAEASDVNIAALYMDYDDGFIAYLNGTEIARSSNMGEYGDEFDWNDLCLAGREAIMYNGNAPEMYDVSSYISQLQDGENILAIEVHNVSASSSDLSSIPLFLMGFSKVQEDFELGNKYVVTNNVYPHTNFKIASSGEAIYLSDDTSLIIDSIPVHYIPEDYSIGRIVSDPEVFAYFGEPTPGYENSANYALEYVSDSVVFEITGEEYDPHQLLEASAPEAGDKIYYTSDGSDPTSSSAVYTGEMDINSIRVVRARVIRENQLPGPITTRTFFTGRKPSLPRVSVSTDPENFFDYNEGIYELGPNASSSNPHFGANFWMDWEKPINLEIYGPDGSEWFNQGAGVKIYGAWSRAHPQKSLAFYARSSYGDGSFSYPLFEAKNISKFESFILRNGGNDFNGSFIRDAVSGYLGDRLNVDHQGYNPAVLYLNGEYYGIMNMREKINEHFIASNHDVHPEDVNILESTGGVVHGSGTSYATLMNFLRTKNISQEGNYAQVKEMMDVDNYIRYWLLQVYIDNRDWPGNNIKFWSTLAPGSKTRWILYDTDFGYSLYDNPGYSLNTLTFALGESNGNWANSASATELMRTLIQNEEFTNSLINQFADRMNTDLLPEVIIAAIDSFELKIKSEIGYHFGTWGGSSGGWNNELTEMRVFAERRPEYMTDHIIDRFDLSGTEDISIDISDTQAGSVRINSIVLNSYPFNGTYFKNVPIELEAIPAPGYHFSHWEGDVESSNRIVTYNMQYGGDFKAVFTDASNVPVNIVINEINYASSPTRNTEDWVEIYNHSSVSVDLKHWKLLDNSSGGVFFIPPGNIITAGGYMVISRNIPDFKRFYPERGPILGELRYGLNSVTDGIVLLDNNNNIHDEVVYGSVAPWPTEANGTGATLELLHPTYDNALPESWKASLDNEGTPNQQNSHLTGIRIYDELPTPEIELYPTIFTDYTTLRLSTDVGEQVSISVLSITGNVVEELANDYLVPGDYQFEWRPGESIESGMYFIHVRTNGSAQTYKVIYR